MLESVKNEFIRLFGELNDARFFFSPGRVNIIGEHIDYNGGYVMPCAINLGTYFIIKKNDLMKVRAYSMQFPLLGICEFDVKDDKKKKEWTDFIKGIIKIFDIHFGFDLVVYGTIPHSSGLSSSASFCTGLGYALSTLNHHPIEGTQLALMCKRVENEFMGVNCGIMDQFIVCNGKKDHALLLNCDQLTYNVIPFDLKNYSLIIANTNKIRQLSDSKYNERKKESEEALKILHDNGYSYENLCDIRDGYEKYLPLFKDEVIARRFKHIVSENLRTIQASEALKQGNIEELGKLLTQSHLSLQNDYEVSGIELDTLVNAFLAQKDCVGARMTGAGFGGCAIAIFPKSRCEEVKKEVYQIYVDKIGYEPSFYQVTINDGVKEIK